MSILKQLLLSIVMLTMALSVVTCIKPPDYPIEPKIEFIAMSRDTMVQGNFNSDSTLIVFSFTDGDGDLGDRDSVNVYLKDNRIGQISGTFKIPLLSQSSSSAGISGEVTLKVYTTCCLFDNGQPPCTPSTSQPFDTLRYEIFIKDRAEHISNSIITPPIYLKCQ